jgi:hypothetical protein
MTSIGDGKVSWSYHEPSASTYQKQHSICTYILDAERQFGNTPQGIKALITWLGSWPVDCIAFEPTAT